TRGIHESYSMTVTDHNTYQTLIPQLPFLLASENPFAVSDILGGIGSSASIVSSAMGLYSAIQTIRETALDIDLLTSLSDTYKQQLDLDPKNEPLQTLCQLLELKLDFAKLLRNPSAITSATSSAIGLTNAATSLAGTAVGALLPSAAAAATLVGGGTVGVSVVLIAFAGFLFTLNEREAIKSHISMRENIQKLAEQTDKSKGNLLQFDKQLKTLEKQKLSPEEKEAKKQKIEENFKNKFISIQKKRIATQQKLSKAMEQGTVGRTANVVGVSPEELYDYRNLIQALCNRPDYKAIFLDFFEAHAPHLLHEFKTDPANTLIKYTFS
ncbi:MAG: hypothetical protein JSR46_09235, partial [Verrucomicrobia bacterium]|nr:hypothetical protein [Verrucomicrobiota bacterium]